MAGKFTTRTDHKVRRSGPVWAIAISPLCRVLSRRWQQLTGRTSSKNPGRDVQLARQFHQFHASALTRVPLTPCSLARGRRALPYRSERCQSSCRQDAEWTSTLPQVGGRYAAREGPRHSGSYSVAVVAGADQVTKLRSRRRGCLQSGFSRGVLPTMVIVGIRAMVLRPSPPASSCDREVWDGMHGFARADGQPR